MKARKAPIPYNARAADRHAPQLALVEMAEPEASSGPDRRGLPRRIREYMATLDTPQGPAIGEPLEALPWQRRFLSGAFAEGVELVALSVARGNGKSTLCAAIGCASLDGPLAIPRGETIAVASSFGQARIVFAHALAMMRERIMEAPHRWRVRDNAQHADITDRRTGATFRVLGSDPKRAHGLAISLAILDEPAAWPAPTSEAMYEAIHTALGKQSGGRVLAIGTRPTDPAHWFARMLDGGAADYAQVHSAPEGCRLDSPRAWRMANPSLPAMPQLRASIAEASTRALREPSLAASFRGLRLNQAVEASGPRTPLLSLDLWRAIEDSEDVAERRGPLILGVDLGGSAAMSACAAYWPLSGRLEAIACFPSTPPETPEAAVERRAAEDGAGMAYQRMAARGELLILGEHIPSVAELLRLAFAKWGAPAAIISDRFRAGELRAALSEADIPRCAYIPRAQGFKHGNEDVQAFRAEAAEGRLHPEASELLRYALSGACTVEWSGAERLAVNNQGGRRSRHRDDAIAASVLCVSEGARWRARTRAIMLGEAPAEAPAPAPLEMVVLA